MILLSLQNPSSKEVYRFRNSKTYVAIRTTALGVVPTALSGICSGLSIDSEEGEDEEEEEKENIR